MTVPITTGDFTDVYFFSPTLGMVVGTTNDQGVICRTTDGGASWTTETFAPTIAGMNYKTKATV
ncbi:hypothetical protein JW935_05920, partial [candidate division KSB1 bacterium]|nr:hypothetical protein [candidate division KSB1 bacterium]